MGIDAAEKILAKADERDGAKARAAIERWLPHRLARLALTRPSEDVTQHPEIVAAHALLAVLPTAAKDDAS